MMLIADSGSTKTEWRLCTKENVVANARTIGLNPLALDKEAVIAELKNSELAKWSIEMISEIYFYGAGIIDDKQRQVVAARLREFIPNANVSANSDLLGAARAVFGQNKGVIGILGTGSNSGLYDGEKIVENIPALGFILADEGSGAVLGRRLIKHFLRNELPEKTSDSLKEYYPQFESLIGKIYSEKHAGRFLASFVPFIYEHKDDEFIKGLLMQELKKFIDLLTRYSTRDKIGLVGSVGFQFQTEINLLAKSASLNIVDYVRNPIDKLTEYHQTLAL